MKLSDLPELTFLDADIDEMLENALVIVKGILGREISRADPLMLFIKAFLMIIAQQRLLIDELAKMNLLAYAKGDALEHLGVLVGVERLGATAATCKVEVKLSAARERATTIKAGTRVTAGDGINFALNESIIFASGETVSVVSATCQELGEIGNGYKVGELNKIVDPQAFLASVVNITETAGGSDVEDDDSLRERIHQAPEKFSNAGSRGAYEYWAKTASNLIADVYVESESPGEVSIYVLLDGGGIPSEEMLLKVDGVLNDKSIRPLTDLIHVKPPVIYNYDVNVTYFIARSNAISAMTIQERCEAAVEEYTLWQKSKLGRDINPTELMYLIRAAGAKRVEVTLPTFAVIPDNAVAIADDVKIFYGGIEED